ncbi:hypothetical protein EUGRSUZ_C00046 [Eucalyptus grandis]|uniref:Uncharacterized protein n=2 Tax=Eucalyptus grandis TaxID=71139 RepID=A0ACC3L9R2_EUCGR|nr:hypothetical protein EUGRSUZ_C00046 [Eucalyptus grandis]
MHKKSRSNTESSWTSTSFSWNQKFCYCTSQCCTRFHGYSYVDNIIIWEGFRSQHSKGIHEKGRNLQHK